MGTVAAADGGTAVVNATGNGGPAKETIKFGDKGREVAVAREGENADLFES